MREGLWEPIGDVGRAIGAVGVAMGTYRSCGRDYRNTLGEGL